MEEIKLDVQVRSEMGSSRVRKMRRENFVPAIVYGGKNKPTAVKIERRSYERIMRHHRGQTVLFHMNVMDGDKKLRDYAVILKEEQHDPVTDSILHIDFNQISLTEKIEVKVPIAAKGEAVGVKKDGGVLEHIMWELDIVCLPTQIPQQLTVDVTHLELNKAVHVRDLVLPEGVTTKHDPESIVLTVVPKREEALAEAAVTEETGKAEPEVIKEKKKEEGEKAKKEGEPTAKPAAKEEKK